MKSFCRPPIARISLIFLTVLSVVAGFGGCYLLYLAAYYYWAAAADPTRGTIYVAHANNLAKIGGLLLLVPLLRVSASGATRFWDALQRRR